MTQLVTRVDDDLIREVDALIAAGIVTSRSEAVRLGLAELVDRERRASIGRQIVEGYRRLPQGEDEGNWTDEDSRRMIAEEPW